MDCPGCHQEMEPVPLEGTYRGPMTIDVCTACRGFWFDAGEQFRLTPAAVPRPADAIPSSWKSRRTSSVRSPSSPDNSTPGQPTIGLKDRTTPAGPIGSDRV